MINASLKAVLLALLLLMPGVSCSPPPDPIMTADAIYFNGDIITINDNEPSAEAIAIKGSKIISVGSMADVERTRADFTKMIDLGGRTLMPSFIQSHGHYVSSLSIANQVNVFAPPAGPGKDISSIVAELKRFRDERKIPTGELIQAYGYDDTLMPNQIALTRDDLDVDFPENPVIVGHISQRGAVLNSAAFRKFGITADTKTPLGGVIQRKPDSEEPAGLIMGTAFLPIVSQLPKPNATQEIDWTKTSQMRYAESGITTVQDGATRAADLEVLERTAKAGANIIDVVAYPIATDFDTILSKYPANTWRQYNNRLKLGGGKITLDGSSQDRNAFFTTPYLTGGPVGEKEWKGGPAFEEATVNAFVKKLYDLNLPVLIDAKGDAAIDMLLRAHEYAALGSLDKDRRTVVIQSHFVRVDQLDKFAAYKLIPSFNTEHIYYFGDTDVVNRGQEQALFLDPMKAAIDKGLRATDHTDLVVAPLNQMFVIWTAVNRISRGGALIGPDQRVTPLEALKAITINAAYQNEEEVFKGSLEPGKLADCVILDHNPLKVDPMSIKDIKVIETIKEAKTIFKRQ